MMQHPSLQEPPLRASSHKNPKPNARHQGPKQAGTREAASRTPAKQQRTPSLKTTPKSDRYAGGAYQNSPIAESLPAPSFEDIPSPPISSQPAVVAHSPPLSVPLEALFLGNPAPAPLQFSEPLAFAALHHPVQAIPSESPHYSLPVARPLFPVMPPPGYHPHHYPSTGPGIYQQPHVYYPPAHFPTGLHDPSYQLPHRPAHQHPSSVAPQYPAAAPPHSQSSGFDSEASSILRAVLKIQS